MGAYALEDVPNLPRIVDSPMPVNWNGSNDARFAVSAVGEGALQYQWFCMDQPIIGETNATLTIPRLLVPQSSGYIHAEVSDGKGAKATSPTWRIRPAL